MIDNEAVCVWLAGVAFIVMLIGSFFIGWLFAHAIVAKECERLNSFYVEKVVFECKVKGLK